MASLSPPTFIFSSLIIILTILKHSSSAKLCNVNDKQVLLAIKSQFINVSTIFDYWDSNDTDCCSLWIGVECNTHGRVTGLMLDFEELGKIPEEMLQLKYLQRIGFSWNSLSGEIPPWLGQLSKLTYINLRNNQLTGSIPPWLSQLSKLTYIELGDNQLTGSIPPTLGNLKSLQYLYLFRNNLSGEIPATLSNLRNLTILDLGRNQLTGSIPASFAAFKNPALELYFSMNNLSGAVPVALGKARVKAIDLSFNRFTGDASFLFGRDKTMLEDIGLNRQ